MSFSRPTLSVIDGGLGQVAPISVEPEVPQAPVALTNDESALWDIVTAALKDYGLIHRTDGMLMAIIVRTYRRWVEAEQQLEAFTVSNDGSYIVKTPNGYEQPHQLFYLCRDLKRELLRWLPEAALTIPSFAKLKQDELLSSGQGRLFDPVEEFRAKKAELSLAHGNDL